MSEITITVSGKVGSGKSALCGEIEILCKALGVPVKWIGGQAEKNLTHADWTEALEMYKPSVTIVEQAARATPADHDDMHALVTRFLGWPLPQSVAADKCATDNTYKFPRSGTNLLNVNEAEAMLRYVLGNDSGVLIQTLHNIAYTVNCTATPKQFADHLQREARNALSATPADHSDETINVAIALERVRALEIVAAVRADGFAKSSTAIPTQAESVFDLACEEIDHRLRNETWELNGVSAPADHSAPEGWRLVPIEPTSDMVIDGFEAVFEFKQTGEFHAMSGCQGASAAAKVCYAAMLTAAPQAPQKVSDADHISQARDAEYRALLGLQSSVEESVRNGLMDVSVEQSLATVQATQSAPPEKPAGDVSDI